MNIPFACHVTYSVECVECGECKVANTYAVLAGQTVPEPLLPAGWHTVNGQVYCPAHTIVIKTLPQAELPQL